MQVCIWDLLGQYGSENKTKATQKFHFPAFDLRMTLIHSVITYITDGNDCASSFRGLFQVLTSSGQHFCPYYLDGKCPGVMKIEAVLRYPQANLGRLEQVQEAPVSLSRGLLLCRGDSPRCYGYLRRANIAPFNPIAIQQGCWISSCCL